MSDFYLVPILPELFLAMSAMGLLIVGVAHGNESTRTICWSAVLAVLLALLILFKVDGEDVSILNGLFKMDDFAGFMKLMILLGTGISLALSVRYLTDENMARFEYPVLVLMAGIGMMLMVSANNLLALYVGLELQSLSLYVLAAFRRGSLASAEAGVKYFSLGALSSGMLLFGSSLVYGFTGSLDFEVIASVADPTSVGLIFGLVFILAGLVFKVSAVPFHMWTPDVYQGAPTCVTAFFAIVPKIAAMGLIVRLLYEPFMSMHDQWGQVIYFVSVASMIVGSFAAIAQDNIKRLMAYSSIGNMGYVLIGVLAGTASGVAAVNLYLFIYMIATAGIFAVILSMRRNGMALEKISDLSGLSRNSPAMAYGLAILMFSMSGIPPMAGFFGKFVVFQAAVAEEMYIIATLGLLTSVVAAYYYLRIIKVMFFDEPVDPFDNKIPFARRVILSLSVAFVVLFAVKPSMLIEATQTAAASLF